MPMVGGKKYGYGPAGMKAAKAAADKTGKPMKMTKPMMPKKKKSQLQIQKKLKMIVKKMKMQKNKK